MTDTRPLRDGEDRVLITDAAARRVLEFVWGGTDWRGAPETEVDAIWRRSDQPSSQVIAVLAAVAPSIGLSEPASVGDISSVDSIRGLGLRVAGSATTTILVGTSEEPLEEIAEHAALTAA